jgi:succinyl-diaminopimelate desuccinylase
MREISGFSLYEVDNRIYNLRKEEEFMKEAIGTLLEELLKFRTVSKETSELKKIIDYVESLFSHPSFRKYRYIRNNKPSLVVSFTDTKNPKVLFVGHLDVVDAEPDQFIPRREGDRIYGRGALDMKGPDAVMIQLFLSMAEGDKTYPAALMLTTDEEVGSFDGVAYLVEEEGWRADFAIIPDGGENFSLIVEGKGVAHIRIKSTGKSAHGSEPWKGDNALDKLIALYDKIKSNFPEEPCGDPEHWHNTISLGKLTGGDSINRIPDSAEMGLDIRFVSPWTVSQIVEMVEGEVKGIPGLSMEVLSTGEVMSTPKDHPLIKTFREAAEEVLGEEPSYSRVHGATDGRFFSQKNIPVVITYPVGDNIHGKNEWVDLNSLVKLYNIFEKFLDKTG